MSPGRGRGLLSPRRTVRQPHVLSKAEDDGEEFGPQANPQSRVSTQKYFSKVATLDRTELGCAIDRDRTARDPVIRLQAQVHKMQSKIPIKEQVDEA